jgi:hypothetical protein
MKNLFFYGHTSFLRMNKKLRCHQLHWHAMAATRCCCCLQHAAVRHPAAGIYFWRYTWSVCDLRTAG